MATNCKASCKCGYEAKIFVGVLESMACTNNYFSPALCKECGKMGSSLFGIDAPTCEFCQSTNIVRYGNSELRAIDKDVQYIDLTSGFYFCPQCKDYGLNFEDVGPIFC